MLGIVFMAAGFLFPPICAVGIILVIVGIVLIASQPTQPMYYAPPPGYMYPAQPAAPGPAAAPASPPSAPCPVCGSPLTWVPQYGRWYCYRCQAYR